ncbi:MAG: hypothetical protein ACUVTU_08620 [Desulfurispora sp.]|uniref:hypothetical protein n=1 Tax=Desulfurispora sp. TaxID=3014275 RepID=UPI00404B565B
MGQVKVADPVVAGDYIEEKIIIDNIPNLGDKSGSKFLDQLEEAIRQCRQFIEQGYRLVDFWSDPDQGVEFTLKKKKH